MKANAVFEGGGMRAIGIVGALKCLENRGVTWKRTAGTSAGSIVASCIAAGYSAKELGKVIAGTDYSYFMDKDKTQRIPIIGRILGFLKENAFYCGDYVEKWISEILKNKGVSSFGDLYSDGESMLRIAASDITKKRILILPDDLVYYGIDPKSFSVARAVRMSSTLPFYYKPVRLEYDSGVSYIVDGGITYGYPIDIFDKDNSNDTPVIGFRFKDTRISFTSEGRTDPLSFVLDIAGAYSLNSEKTYDLAHNISRTIFIPTLGIGGVDFKIPKDKFLKLYKAGYKSASKFFKTWSFKDALPEYNDVCNNLSNSGTSQDSDVDMCN